MLRSVGALNLPMSSSRLVNRYRPRLGCGKLALQVVQARVMKLDLGEPLVHVIHRSREIETTMAVEAFQAFAEEQAFTALRRFGDGIGVVAALIAVVRRIAGKNRPLT